MGKKHSNKKKKRPLVENVSKNCNGEKHPNAAFNSNLKKENKKCEKDASLKAQNKLSHGSQSIKTLSRKSDLEETNNTSVASQNADAKKSSKKCKQSSITPSSAKNSPEALQIKPVTLAPFENKDPVLRNVYPVFNKNCFSSDSEEEQFDYSVRKDYSVQSKSGIQREAPGLMMKDFNDKSYLTDFLGDDCYESDNDVPCDFFQPVFNEYQNSANSKNKDLRKNLHGMNVNKSYPDDSILSSQPGSSTAKSYDKDDLEIPEGRYEFLYSVPPYLPVDSSEMSDSDYKIELKENISCRVGAYENSKETFAEVYRTWLPVRRGTLKKLKALLSEVHGDQLNFNKSQVACKEVGCLARYAKNNDNQVVSFLGSFTAFLTDAACGVVSAAQAFNIDSYQSKFKEIMEEDAQITKRLYTERSNCVMEYQNIEEVMRKFHPDSFSTTVSKISSSLEINKYWKSMKEAYGRDDMPQLLNIVSEFFDNAFQPSKLDEVKDSVLSYVGDNPNALEACKSATQATYGYLDTWTLNQSPIPVLKGASTAANHYLIAQNRIEISRLNDAISEDLPQSKLESQIEDAIDSLESEMKEINHTYYELFKIYVDCNGSEWEISEMY